jgi:hypothetical protein
MQVRSRWTGAACARYAARHDETEPTTALHAPDAFACSKFRRTSEDARRLLPRIPATAGSTMSLFRRRVVLVLLAGAGVPMAAAQTFDHGYAACRNALD